jgi:hypothetical protein
MNTDELDRGDIRLKTVIEKEEREKREERRENGLQVSIPSSILLPFLLSLSLPLSYIPHNQMNR